MGKKGSDDASVGVRVGLGEVKRGEEEGGEEEIRCSVQMS